MADVSPESLVGRWLRAADEDTPTEKVYRRADALTRGRPREEFELHPEGHYTHFGVQPTDALSEERGTWKLEGGRLHLIVNQDPSRTKQLDVVKVDPNRLVVSK